MAVSLVGTLFSSTGVASFNISTLTAAGRFAVLGFANSETSVGTIAGWTIVSSGTAGGVGAIAYRMLDGTEGTVTFPVSSAYAVAVYAGTALLTGSPTQTVTSTSTATTHTFASITPSTGGLLAHAVAGDCGGTAQVAFSADITRDVTTGGSLMSAIGSRPAVSGTAYTGSATTPQPDNTSYGASLLIRELPSRTHQMML